MQLSTKLYATKSKSDISHCDQMRYVRTSGPKYGDFEPDYDEPPEGERPDGADCGDRKGGTWTRFRRSGNLVVGRRGFSGGCRTEPERRLETQD